MPSSARLGTTLAALLVTLPTGLLAACGGGSGGGSPDDAAKQDFCNQAAKLLQAKSGADVRTWATDMKKIGTPQGITDSQRQGFEKTIELASKSKGTGSSTGDNLGTLDPNTDDGKNVLAFIGYAENTCPDSFQDALPSASPS